ncbi:MAG: hypothetical protein J6T27_04605 [Alphaproteobacteria bacterium]|nr:hypothetical protein [Alphaproteobacteria bacterium]
MKTKLKIFYGISIFAIVVATNIANAAITQRTNTAATTAAANRAQNRTPSTATRMPTATVKVTEPTSVATAPEPEPEPVVSVAEPEPVPEPVIIVNNKTSQFNDVLSEMGANASDSSNSELAETIRRQRALLDAQADKASAGGTSNITTSNTCDAGLRKCMTEKCGADFTKCAKDSTTVWGNKMDACRRNTKCTGHEYTLLAPEILADRNAAIELSYYNSVVNCGNRYNNCVFGICGKSLEKCLSKSAGDSAIAKCKSIADECGEQDSGLSSRVMGIMGDMRTIATSDAQKQEKRLYELRDLMRDQCTRLGAMFDERTLDCVYTVNFFAGTDHTLMASKKLYSGDTFQCTPDWFGVDITTYMENAQRLTRSQTSASAAAMGAGFGTAAGLWTSGAVIRGIDTQNAEKQAKEACENDGGEWVSAGFNQGKKCDMSNAEQNCTNSGGTWNGTGCTRTQNSSTGGGRNPENDTKNSSNQFSIIPKEGMGHDSRAEGTNINYNAATSNFGTDINTSNKSSSNFLTNDNEPSFKLSDGFKGLGSQSSSSGTSGESGGGSSPANAGHGNASGNKGA